MDVGVTNAGTPADANRGAHKECAVAANAFWPSMRNRLLRISSRRSATLIPAILSARSCVVTGRANPEQLDLHTSKTGSDATLHRTQRDKTNSNAAGRSPTQQDEPTPTQSGMNLEPISESHRDTHRCLRDVPTGP